LLLNVLPAPIAEKLKRQKGIIAERYDDVSVLFADIVGFTPLSVRLAPSELLEMLNRVFSGFDELAGQHGVEKIKTIGDAYMVAGGLPEPHTDHLGAMAAMALAMQAQIKQLTIESSPLNLRIGLHVGSVIAGVIGIRKFIYDVWGDTVNTASRLESHGLPGRIHVSESVRDRLQKRYVFEPRGVIDLKGRGATKTFFLNGVAGV
jgi:class 3 adenylate cyclase